MTAQRAYTDESDGWGPLVLPEHLEAPPLPLDLLPPVLGDYSRVVSESAQIDPAVPALLGLGAAAALSQKTARVRATTQWAESLPLFILAIADVSERKTAAYSHMVGPVHRIEADLDEEGREQRTYNAERKRMLERQLDELRKQAAKGDVPLEQVTEQAAYLETLPDEKPPRLAVDDCTLEELKSLMAENHGRISLLSPEAGFLSVLAGAYTSNGKPADMTALLSAYTGTEPIRVDRKGRPSERIDRPSLTVVMVGQPRVLEDLRGIKGVQERGLMARFLPVRVPTRAGTRFLMVGDMPAPEDTPEGIAYAGLLRELASRTPEDVPPELRLSSAALDHYRNWHDELELERGPEGGQWSAIGDFAGKAHGLCLRFAGLSHLCQHPGAGDGDLIDLETIQAACALTDWALEAHRAAVVGLNVTPEIKRVHRLLGLAERGTLSQSRAERGPWAPFTLRDIRRSMGNSSNPMGNAHAEETATLLVDLSLARFSKDVNAFIWHAELVNGGGKSR